MQKRALPSETLESVTSTKRTGKRLSASALSDCFIKTEQLPLLIEDYLSYGKIECHSERTIAKRQCLLERLVWFLDEKGFEQCGVLELRRFFSYLSSSHTLTMGRWGKGLSKRWTTPMRPATIKTYWLTVASFCNWLVDEDFLASSPMEAVPCVDARKDQIEHFSADQMNALFRAAEKSHHPRRDYAIVRLLLATGMRASELCSLQIKHLDIEGRTVRVHGKGNKYRTLSFGLKTRRALLAYLREGEMNENDPLFPADRGRKADGALGPRGLHLLVKRLGEIAELRNVRCSPHTFRHTYAYEFLKGGGDAFTLMHSLGHTSLTITNQYVNMAQADVVMGMKKWSPDDRF